MVNPGRKKRSTKKENNEKVYEELMESDEITKKEALMLLKMVWDEDKLTVAETIDNIADKTDYNKGDVRKQFREVRKKKLKEEKRNSEEKEDEGPKEVSSYFNGENLYEEVKQDGEVKFIYLNDGSPKFISGLQKENGESIVPINDESIEKGAVILPNDINNFGEDSEAVSELIDDIRRHIHRYVDVSNDFELFSAYYILMSWVFDKLTTIPYLRVLGDTGSGKSRFLNVVGRLCYKPCILGGSITPAPIYRMISKWHGTLIVDEADQKDTDITSEITTILNCGFERGRPVVRCKSNDVDTLQYFDTFGPKVFSTRETFKDKALESRCLTENMVETNREIPSNLGKEFYEEEQRLRNKLLYFRLKWYDKIEPENVKDIDLGPVEPRLKQMAKGFAVLFCNIPNVFKRFKNFLQNYNKELIMERQGSFYGKIVTIIVNDLENYTSLSSGVIAERLEDQYKYKDMRPQTVGMKLKSLGLETENKRIEGSKRRAIKKNNKLMKKLIQRYIPKDDWDEKIKSFINGHDIDNLAKKEPPKDKNCDINNCDYKAEFEVEDKYGGGKMWVCAKHYSKQGEEV